jgi:Platelet-activating factor acetylhydrolase, isoform II
MVQLLVLLFLMIFGTGASFRQSNSALPSPTGPYKVGRVLLSWVDRNRPEIMTPMPDDFREVMVYVWYPASNVNGAAGPYMPGADRLHAIATGIGLSNQFGPIWMRIESNELRSHAFDNAPIILDRKLPVLVFAPGGGTTPITYTTQMEELASHGYCVVGVVHTYEVPAVVFPDNRVVTAANAYWARLGSQIPDTETLEKTISDILAQDIRFVIDKLIELNADRTSMFYGRLNTARFGVFGHSRGGRTSARVCQLDSRVAACLSEDGSFSWQPFWLDASGASMKQPFMMIDHLDPELPDEAFTQMGTTREAYAANRTAKRDQARETIYKTIGGGSYHLTISTPGISHNSFSDVRLLGRQDAPTINLWPKDVQATTPHPRILSTVTAYVRAFFDKYVQNIPAPLLGASPMPDVEVRRYGAAQN